MQFVKAKFNDFIGTGGAPDIPAQYNQYEQQYEQHVANNQVTNVLY